MVSHTNHRKTVSTFSGEDHIVVPAEGKHQDYFVVFLSGDGGWTAIDRGESEALSQNGVPVVGFDMLSLAS